MNSLKSKLSCSYMSPVVTVGSFDGVHLGHRKILTAVLENARKKNSDPVVITFSTHPKKLLAPESAPPCLTTPEEKIEEINNFGIKNVIVIDFTKKIADMEAETFAREILIKQLCAETIIIGYDHAFGKNREGDMNFLKNVSDETGVEIIRIEEYISEKGDISSTHIREELLDGNVEGIENFLGRKYSITGEVVKGEGRGRKIGFPTANLDPDNPDKLIPQDGVYAVMIKHDESLFKGMLNIGNNPTFKHNHKTIEVNIIDFNKDIYGDRIDIIFYKKIRGEKTFSSADELKENIFKDREIILQYFKELNE